MRITHEMAIRVIKAVMKRKKISWEAELVSKFEGKEIWPGDLIRIYMNVEIKAEEAIKIINRGTKK